MTEKKIRKKLAAKVTRGVPEFASRLFRTHLAQLDRHVRRVGVGGLLSLYKEARADLHDRLRRAAGGPRSERATAVQLRAMIAQADGVLEVLGGRVERHLADVGKTAAQLGARHAVDEYKALERHFTGTTPVLDLERSAAMRGLVSDAESSLLRRYHLVSRTWSLGAISAMEQRLSVGVLAGKPVEEMIDDVMSAGGVLDGERYKAERIVRTEAAFAHGRVKFEAMRATARELGDDRLQKRLISTFDDRTGDDSFLLHGQTVPIDEPFRWKHRVGGSWKVTEYMHPPNRPNDREVVIPWDPSWEDVEGEAPLSRSELESAAPTRWRKTPGVEIPPGHKPGKAYRS